MRMPQEITHEPQQNDFQQNAFITVGTALKEVSSYFLLYALIFAAVFWMSRNTPPKERGALRDIQKTAAKETNDFPNQLIVAFLSVIIFAQLVCRKEHVKPIKQYFDRICC